MDDLISRQAVLDGKMAAVISGQAIDVVPASYIKDLPSAQPERPRGKWIEDGYYNLPAVCCYCGEVGKRFWNFCPSCGTDMRKEAAK